MKAWDNHSTDLCTDIVLRSRLYVCHAAGGGQVASGRMGGEI